MLANSVRPVARRWAGNESAVFWNLLRESEVRLYRWKDKIRFGRLIKFLIIFGHLDIWNKGFERRRRRRRNLQSNISRRRSYEFIQKNYGATHYVSRCLHAFGVNFANTREVVNDTRALRDCQWRSLYTFTMRLMQQIEVAVPQRGLFWEYALGALHARIVLLVDIAHIVSHMCHTRCNIYCIIRYNILLLRSNGDIEKRSWQLGATHIL